VSFPSRRRVSQPLHDSRETQPIESLPPFAIIVGAITAMGGVQYLVHHAYEGKPKPVGADNFDRLLKYRDQRLKEEKKVRGCARAPSRDCQSDARSRRREFVRAIFSSPSPSPGRPRFSKLRLDSDIAASTP
jgi:NADH dehydrogenase (ubiquinone) 1 alpha subcomplex subunit 1